MSTDRERQRAKRKRWISILEEDLADRNPLDDRTIVIASSKQSFWTRFFSRKEMRSGEDFFSTSIPTIIAIFLCLVGWNISFPIPQIRTLLTIFLCIFSWSLIVQTRGRLQDSGNSKFLVILLLIPLINIVFYLYLLFCTTKK